MRLAEALVATVSKCSDRVAEQVAGMLMIDTRGEELLLVRSRRRISLLLQIVSARYIVALPLVAVVEAQVQPVRPLTAGAPVQRQGTKECGEAISLLPIEVDGKVLRILQRANSRLTLLRTKAVLRPGVVADALDAPAIIEGVGQIGLRIRIEGVVLPTSLHFSE